MVNKNGMLFTSAEASNILRAMRESRNKTQHQAAQMFDITQSVIASRENDYKTMRLDTLEKMASGYGYSIQFIVKDKMAKKHVQHRINVEKAKAHLEQFAPQPETENNQEPGANNKAA